MRGVGARRQDLRLEGGQEQDLHTDPPLCSVGLERHRGVLHDGQEREQPSPAAQAHRRPQGRPRPAGLVGFRGYEALHVQPQRLQPLQHVRSGQGVRVRPPLPQLDRSPGRPAGPGLARDLRGLGCHRGGNQRYEEHHHQQARDLQLHSQEAQDGLGHRPGQARHDRGLRGRQEVPDRQERHVRHPQVHSDGQER